MRVPGQVTLLPCEPSPTKSPNPFSAWKIVRRRKYWNWLAFALSKLKTIRDGRFVDWRNSLIGLHALVKCNILLLEIFRGFWLARIQIRSQLMELVTRSSQYWMKYPLNAAGAIALFHLAKLLPTSPPPPTSSETPLIFHPSRTRIRLSSVYRRHRSFCAHSSIYMIEARTIQTRLIGDGRRSPTQNPSVFFGLAETLGRRNNALPCCLPCSRSELHRSRINEQALSRQLRAGRR